MKYLPAIFSSCLLGSGLFLTSFFYTRNFDVIFLAAGSTYSVFLACLAYDILKKSKPEQIINNIITNNYNDEKFRKIFDSIGRGVIIIDGSGQIVDSNVAGSLMLGFMPEKINGLQLYDNIEHFSKEGTEYDWHNSPISKAIINKETIYLENEKFNRKNVSPMNVSLTIVPLINIDGSASEAVVTFSDTSLRFNLENELKQANSDLERKVIEKTADILHAKELAENAWAEAVKNKDKAEEAYKFKSAFLANISHEFRTPLHAILAFSELISLRKESTSAEKLTKYSESINSSASHLLTIVNDLLDMSSLERGQLNYNFSDVYFTKLLEQTLDQIWPMLKKKNIELFVDAKIEGKDFLKCDPSRISQVIWNLLSNSIKFSEPDTKIVISIENAEVINYPGISVSVIDQGKGLVEGEEEKIFERFFSSAYSDTGISSSGLGLSISKEIVEQHGGFIFAKNNSNDVGATIKFAIPLIPPKLRLNHEKYFAA